MAFNGPSSESTFSQPFKEKYISEVVRIGGIIIFRPGKLWKATFSILWCDISGEAAGEIWHWSLLGVKGLKKNLLIYQFLESTRFVHLTFWINPGFGGILNNWILIVSGERTQYVLQPKITRSPHRAYSLRSRVANFEDAALCSYFLYVQSRPVEVRPDLFNVFRLNSFLSESLGLLKTCPCVIMKPMLCLKMFI